jgi:hypothetical protein
MRIPRGLASQPLVVAIVGGVAATILGSMAVVAMKGSGGKTGSDTMSTSRSAATVAPRPGRTPTTSGGSRAQSSDERPGTAADKPAQARFLDDVSVAAGDDPDKGQATIGGETFEHSLRYIVTASVSARERATEYNLGGHYQKLTATLGLEEGADGGVVFSIFVDGRRILARDVNVGQLAPINVDVTAGSRLRLTVAPAAANGLPLSGKSTAVWGSAKLS